MVDFRGLQDVGLGGVESIHPSVSGAVTTGAISYSVGSCAGVDMSWGLKEWAQQGLIPEASINRDTAHDQGYIEIK